MTRYTASVVGAGSGGRLSIDALAASDRYDLTAVADTSPTARAALAKKYPSLKLYDSYQAMFDSSASDVVCVSTWPPSHREIVAAALQLPLKGILVEKPLAETHASAAAILEQIEQKSLPMVVPHGLLVAAHAVEILGCVRAGDIGDLCLIEIQCDGWDIISAGVHWLNYAYWLTGREPVASVLAACDSSSRTFRDGMQVETSAVTYAQTRSGVRIVMNTGDHVTTTRKGKGVVYRIVGTNGLIEFWAWESAYLIVNAANPGGSVVKVPPAAEGGHRQYLESLAREMDAGVSAYEIPKSSLAALEWCEAAYLSSKWRCQVNLPLADFTPPPPSDWEPGKPYSGTGGGRDGRKLG